MNMESRARPNTLTTKRKTVLAMAACAAYLTQIASASNLAQVTAAEKTAAAVHSAAGVAHKSMLPSAGEGRVKALSIPEPSGLNLDASAIVDQKILNDSGAMLFYQSDNSADQQLAQLTTPDDQTGSVASATHGLAKFFTDRPYLLIVFALVSVTMCCLLSQILLGFSKHCNLSLNRYYIRKRFEKQKMMQQAIHQNKLLRDQQRRATEQRGGGDDLETPGRIDTAEQQEPMNDIEEVTEDAMEFSDKESATIQEDDDY